MYSTLIKSRDSGSLVYLQTIPQRQHAFNTYHKRREDQEDFFCSMVLSFIFAGFCLNSQSFSTTDTAFPVSTSFSKMPGPNVATSAPDSDFVCFEYKDGNLELLYHASGPLEPFIDALVEAQNSLMFGLIRVRIADVQSSDVPTRFFSVIYNFVPETLPIKQRMSRMKATPYARENVDHNLFIETSEKLTFDEIVKRMPPRIAPSVQKFSDTYSGPIKEFPVVSSRSRPAGTSAKPVATPAVSAANSTAPAEVSQAPPQAMVNAASEKAASAVAPTNEVANVEPPSPEDVPAPPTPEESAHPASENAPAEDNNAAPAHVDAVAETTAAAPADVEAVTHSVPENAAAPSTEAVTEASTHSSDDLAPSSEDSTNASSESPVDAHVEADAEVVTAPENGDHSNAAAPTESEAPPSTETAPTADNEGSGADSAATEAPAAEQPTDGANDLVPVKEDAPVSTPVDGPVAETH